MKLRKWFMLLLTSFIVIIVLLRLFIALYPVSYDTDGHYSLGVVFGAGILKSGEPSITLKFRLDKAVSLYNSSRIDNIFISGLVPEASVMKNYLIKKNVPLSNIITDDKGETTFITVRNVKQYMISNNINDGAVFISQKYHIPRISFIVNKIKLSGVHYIASDPNKINFVEETLTILREALAWLKNMFIDNDI